MRGQRIGRRLMREAEAEARRRGCQGAWSETFTFQAREFYEKIGYRAFGVISHDPPGHERIFMLKELTS